MVFIEPTPCKLGPSPLPKGVSGTISGSSVPGKTLDPHEGLILDVFTGFAGTGGVELGIHLPHCGGEPLFHWRWCEKASLWRNGRTSRTLAQRSQRAYAGGPG